ncbi:hypothetical protein C8F04DRAFT_677119 [Mycena alexandri]|uniref:CsbD-like domain-containing protein n=1 Tax=Mycena alexandri TaxID=1745969 RepID=A0AAD6STY8_9AGAR|nr:hypothetical protein C8F04DRAFT_677119 [Mycena alexandri]
MSSEPSQANGQMHSVKGQMVEKVGDITGADSWKTSGKKEHAEGEAEQKTAQAQTYVEGLTDRATGLVNNVMGKMTGNSTKEMSGNLQDKEGQAKMEANKM